MTKTKREWCAMLAKLTAPMNAATAVEAFIGMLPLLPQDDAAYNRDTLELAARREPGDPAIPNFDVLSRVFGRWERERRPIEQRLGSNPAVPGITHALPDLRRPPAKECEYVADLVATFKAEVAAREFGRKLDVVPPGYLHGVNLAIARRNAGIPLSPDLRAILDQHEAGSNL